MQSKLHIDLSQGLVEVEGEADLVREIYRDLKDHLLSGAPAPARAQSRAREEAPTPDTQGETKPKGKRPSSITQLSGGEKTLTATALLFAIYLIKPAPFCILDEVDAPLDDANVGKFTNMIRKFSEESQFIIVTHNKMTMSAVDVIYGVTMQEPGVSKLVPVDFRGLN